jgi:hypothetical protein
VRAPRLLALALAVAAALAAASIAAAQFTGSVAGGSMALASGTLAPPSAVAAAQTSCRNNKPVQITATWTATTSAFATGYTIERSPTSGGPFSAVGTVAAGTTAYVDTDPTLAYTTTYYYRVQATFNSWTAASAQTSVTTLNSKCR